jgi:hypothetical protein
MPKLHAIRAIITSINQLDYNLGKSPLYGRSQALYWHRAEEGDGAGWETVKATIRDPAS